MLSQKAPRCASGNSCFVTQSGKKKSPGVLRGEVRLPSELPGILELVQPSPALCPGLTATRRREGLTAGSIPLLPLLRNSCSLSDPFAWGPVSQAVLNCTGIWISFRISEMKGLLTLAWFLACSVPAVPGGLLDLKSMIEKMTGKNALLNYGFYGCYCGWGGRGTPKDATDWCCWLHDHCYGLLEKKGCRIWTQSYKHSFSRGQVTCGLGHFCQVQLCSCDRKLVYCLKRNLRSYNPGYRYFPNIFCT
ncbi:phospholipase A2 group V isoform X2 [Saccopteryx bilineata]|uniref:phospholipase A2 group V isoform X2 n=1 Tax=Saccopteryx bilineata TaxID=59482 RepID=UPI00338E3977